MKIALIGYGNMGQEIERVVEDQQTHTIVSISYKNRNGGLDTKGLQKADVAIDFTSPQIVLQNIEQVLQLGIPLVVGTTGWYEALPDVAKIVKQHKGSLIYGQNFSIGANIFFKIVAYASSLLNQYEEYDVFGVETHHTGKKDSPSGTARKLADVVLQNFPRKKELQTEKLDRQIRPDEFHFASVRGGRNFGRHEIVFDSQSDEIRLLHQAWGRRGFAQGAVVAAEFIRGKKGLYNFSDVIDKMSS
ncbi:MAG: 4-hydroxy-tetrahydrodipicolinate reductase [Candidatus Levybacteria bacterium]|nr:4-hydroxy-tetrahydrodipicolinate reductase [Candidatus Levybacteria bacterium]